MCMSVSTVCEQMWLCVCVHVCMCAHVWVCDSARKKGIILVYIGKRAVYIHFICMFVVI